MEEVFGLLREAAKNAIGVKEPVDCREHLADIFMWTIVRQNSGTIILKR
jgi:hypothetical protein